MPTSRQQTPLHNAPISVALPVRNQSAADRQSAFDWTAI